MKSKTNKENINKRRKVLATALPGLLGAGLSVSPFKHLIKNEIGSKKEKVKISPNEMAIKRNNNKG